MSQNYQQGQAPFQRHSNTSRAAALEIEPSASTLRGQLLAALRAAGERGMTDEEMQYELGMNPSTQRPRRIELCRGGFIEASGKRLTISRRKALVWRARR